MFLAKLTFGRRTDRTAQTNAAEWYLASLLKNGQICGNYQFAWYEGRLIAYAHVPRPNALDIKHHSQWAKADLDSIVSVFGNMPEVELIDDDIPKRFPSWKRSGSLFLYTHSFDDRPPVRCGDTGTAVPSYLLPIPHERREDLYFWQRSYRINDEAWMASQALEIPAYRQLTEVSSDLAKDGRKLCQEIELALGKPVYYFLYRHWGRKEGEPQRPCPGCGRQWHLSDVQTYEAPFQQFHFRCVPCRLVSHCASTYDDQRHARIGEYRAVSR